MYCTPLHRPLHSKGNSIPRFVGGDLDKRRQMDDHYGCTQQDIGELQRQPRHWIHLCVFVRATGKSNRAEAGRIAHDRKTAETGWAHQCRSLARGNSFLDPCGARSPEAKCKGGSSCKCCHVLSKQNKGNEQMLSAPLRGNSTHLSRELVFCCEHLQTTMNTIPD